MPVERKRVLIPAEIEESIDYANRELAKKEWMPHNPAGLEPHRIQILHNLLPYAYLHTANLPVEKLKEITSSEKALNEYVFDVIYGREHPFKPKIAVEALQFDLHILQDEEKGPALLAKLKEKYYQPLHVKQTIGEANTSLVGLTLPRLHKTPLTEKHCEAIAALPPFSRKFLITWLMGHERLPPAGLFDLSTEQRAEVRKIAEDRRAEFVKILEGRRAKFAKEAVKGPSAVVLKFVEDLVLGEKALHRRALTPEQREFDRIMLRADRAHQFDAIRKLYLGYVEKKKK
ncbi:hypothetical protein H0O03_03870 [Candidatus Micrarchaeota archaeon]|nr:hypothetical protein [Candidatus Micrarchaeota archaeon]